MKWQPVLLLVDGGGRIECECGALAIIVMGRNGSAFNILEEVDCYCQECYEKAQAEEEKEAK